jgi:hypothetical protein
MRFSLLFILAEPLSSTFLLIRSPFSPTYYCIPLFPSPSSQYSSLSQPFSSLVLFIPALHLIIPLYTSPSPAHICLVQRFSSSLLLLPGFLILIILQPSSSPRYSSFYQPFISSFFFSHANSLSFSSADPLFIHIPPQSSPSTSYSFSCFLSPALTVLLSSAILHSFSARLFPSQFLINQASFSSAQS